MSSELQENARILSADLLDQLTLENVWVIAIYMESDGGLNKTELDTITRSSTKLQACKGLLEHTRARGDASIVSLANALRRIQMRSLAERLAPAVQHPTAGPLTTGGTFEGRAPAARREVVSEKLRVAHRQITKRLSEPVVDAKLEQLHSSQPSCKIKREKEIVGKCLKVCVKCSAKAHIRQKICKKCGASFESAKPCREAIVARTAKATRGYIIRKLHERVLQAEAAGIHILLHVLYPSPSKKSVRKQDLSVNGGARYASTMDSLKCFKRFVVSGLVDADGGGELQAASREEESGTAERPQPGRRRQSGGYLQASTVQAVGDLQDSTMRLDADLQASTTERDADLQASTTERDADLQASTMRLDADLQDSTIRLDADLQASTVERGDLQASTTERDVDLQASTMRLDADLKDSAIHLDADLQASTVERDGDLQASTTERDGDLQAGIAVPPKESGRTTRRTTRTCRTRSRPFYLSN